MTHKYAIVVAPADLSAPSLPELQSPNGPVVRYQRSRLTVYATAATPVAAITPADGCVVGEIYHRHGPARPLNSIEESTGQTMAKGEFRDLLGRYWGSYIAIIDCGDSILVGRDPSASMPCYWTKVGPCTLFASHASLLSDLAGSPHPIDWAGLSRYLYAGGLPMPETALEGVREILPGTALRLRGTSAEVIATWSPWDHVGTRANVPIEDNVATLRRTVQACVAARARQFSRPIITVSGGLDSSIVALAAKGASQNPLGMTMYTDDPAGDERGYAKILCDALQMELTSVRYDISAVDIDKPYSPHLPRPVGRTIGVAYESALITLAQFQNADGFLSGNGGDNVFAYSRSAKAAVDRYLTEGLGRGIFQTLRDIAAITGASYAGVCRAAWRAYRKRKMPYGWQPSQRFLHPDLIRDAACLPLSHPWLEGPESAFPGQYSHIAGILRSHQHLEPQRSRVAVAVAPLLSQPILELSLAVPGWQWCAGGRDRSLIRAAFERDLPAVIVNRRVKGTPDGFNAEILQFYRAEIWERLLYGRLAKAGFLDTSAIEDVLGDSRTATPEDRTRIVDLLDTEAWLSHWSDGDSAAFAARRS